MGGLVISAFSCRRNWFPISQKISMSLSSDLPSWTGWVFQRRLSISYTKDKAPDARVLENRCEKKTWVSAFSMHVFIQCPLMPVPPHRIRCPRAQTLCFYLSTKVTCQPSGWKRRSRGLKFFEQPSSHPTYFNLSPLTLSSEKHYTAICRTY